jgi:hypothetical protein
MSDSTAIQPEPVKAIHLDRGATVCLVTLLQCAGDQKQFSQYQSIDNTADADAAIGRAVRAALARNPNLGVFTASTVLIDAKDAPAKLAAGK